MSPKTQGKKQKGMESGTSSMPNPIEVQKYLGGLDYPADKQTIIDHAQGEDAPMEVMDMLDQIPDFEYSSPADLTRELGKIS